MPKISGKVLDTKIDAKGRFLAMIQLNKKPPRKHERITVKWGQGRSDSQNAFYWLFLTYLMGTCGLEEEYDTNNDLHETLKATFLSKKTFTKSGLEIIRVGSTTKLNKSDFVEYLSKVNKAMIEYHNVDTSAFWKEYEEEWKI